MRWERWRPWVPAWRLCNHGKGVRKMVINKLIRETHHLAWWRRYLGFGRWRGSTLKIRQETSSCYWEIHQIAMSMATISLTCKTRARTTWSLNSPTSTQAPTACMAAAKLWGARSPESKPLCSKHSRTKPTVRMLLSQGRLLTCYSGKRWMLWLGWRERITLCRSSLLSKWLKLSARRRSLMTILTTGGALSLKSLKPKLLLKYPMQSDMRSVHKPMLTYQMICADSTTRLV